MDVHKESIDVSLTEEGRSGEVRHCGVIPGDLEAVAEVLRGHCGRRPGSWGSCTRPARARPSLSGSRRVDDIAWKAHLRLTSRFRKLVARGKAKPKVATAIACDLTGFIWAIAREAPQPPA